ncbi:hypothetical protein SASPL_156925 [Salvia splendens]|uniref:Mono-/di-acylglycerol lipase N-terminal domain-containing protein n=1 Tax=Salvia splendens TaxID=180675 RepID=A0A8X8YV65_SALSN|nr:hypothetical protein SASPL_156925 [Salvia splendens]
MPPGASSDPCSDGAARLTSLVLPPLQLVRPPLHLHYPRSIGMSILCGVPLLECVYCIGCVRWAWKRCLHNAAHDSQEWGLATPQEFEPVPRLCRYIMAVYEDDLSRPLWEPPGGYGIDPDCVILKRSYKDICVA